MRPFENDLSPAVRAVPALAPRSLDSLKARRKLWLDVHLWLGLILGLFLSIFGITGSILVFYQEVDDWLNAPHTMVVAESGGTAAFRPFGEIIDAAQAAIPNHAKLGFVDYPRDAEHSYQVNFLVGSLDAANEQTDQWRVYVDPYKARVIAQRLIKRADDILPKAFIPFVFQLHFALLADSVGGIVVGIMATLLVFSALTGIIVWWPLTGHWRRALSVKWQASVQRLNHDLHQVAGIYTVAILLAILISGIYMNLPDYFTAPVKLLSPGTRAFADAPKSGQASGRSSIGMGRAFDVASAAYPEGRPNWLSGPSDDQGAYLVSFRDVPALSRFWSERIISVDQYDGQILEVRDPSTRLTAGETFLDWQWPLHSGKAFGWTGRILVFLSGLACPVLFVTGVIRWLQKRRARRFDRAGIGLTAA